MAEADLNIDSEGQSKVGESESDAFERAQQEWDNIKPLPIISLSDQSSADGSIFTEQNSGILTIEEADGYIAILDISEELKYIKPSAEQRGFISFLRKIFLLNAPTMRSTGCRNRIFAIAMKPLDAKDTVHSKLLTTIYHKLTRQPVIKCPRYGNHWEEIGFQGTDPATDLRGVGLLGLYQLMFLVSSSETEQLGQKIYQLSTDKKQQFPFCVMGTNVTAIALHTLREGHLNKEFNRRKSESVIKLFNLFFCGLYCRLYNKWKNGRKTVADAGFVLKELRTEATRNVADTMDFVFALDNKESSKRTKRDATESERKSNDANGDVNCTQFSDIGNVFDDDNQCDIDSDGSGSHQERAIM